jgi:hypothetical protein
MHPLGRYVIISRVIGILIPKGSRGLMRSPV